MFKMFGNYVHGQRGYSNQIYENICITLGLNKQRNELLSTMVDFNMKDFLISISKHKSTSDSMLQTPKRISSSTNLQIISLCSKLDSDNLMEGSKFKIDGIGTYIFINRN